MRNKLFLITLTATALTAAVVAAGPGDPHRSHDEGQSKTHHADADADGAVTPAEWDALFAELDADKNGTLTGDELPGRRHHGPPPAGAIAGFLANEADADADGTVTAAEFEARIEALDGDGDGALDMAELHTRHHMRVPAGEPMGLPPFLNEHDTDADGKLGLAELQTLFAAADTDGNGSLAGDEIALPRFHGRHH